MPSVQVSLIVETEKKASGIESDAHEKAQEILSSANAAASINRLNICSNTDALIETILSEARDMAAKIFKEEEIVASEKILSLQNTASVHRAAAIDAAVHVLTGRA